MLLCSSNERKKMSCYRLDAGTKLQLQIAAFSECPRLSDARAAPGGPSSRLSFGFLASRTLVFNRLVDLGHIAIGPAHSASIVKPFGLVPPCIHRHGTATQVPCLRLARVAQGACERPPGLQRRAHSQGNSFPRLCARRGAAWVLRAQDYRVEVNDADAGPHTMRKRTIKSQRPRKERASKADPKRTPVATRLWALLMLRSYVQYTTGRARSSTTSNVYSFCCASKLWL
jgi:hypothetical protein